MSKKMVTLNELLEIKDFLDDGYNIAAIKEVSLF